MKSQSFVASFTVDQTPEEVFAAVNTVRGWWSEDIDGDTEHLDSEFTFFYQDIHRSTQKITELIPGKKVVWLVREGYLNFAQDSSEWTGTTIVFEISEIGNKTKLTFTHVGLVPEIECFANCSRAWDFHVGESLRSLIMTGEGQPNRSEKQAVAV